MFNQLKDSTTCCMRHITHTPPDSLDNQFVQLDCEDDNCKDKNFCQRIKRVIEDELNDRYHLEILLSKQGQ